MNTLKVFLLTRIVCNFSKPCNLVNLRSHNLNSWHWLESHLCRQWGRFCWRLCFHWSSLIRSRRRQPRLHQSKRLLCFKYTIKIEDSNNFHNFLTWSNYSGETNCGLGTLSRIGGTKGATIIRISVATPEIRQTFID